MPSQPLRRIGELYRQSPLGFGATTGAAIGAGSSLVHHITGLRRVSKAVKTQEKRTEKSPTPSNVKKLVNLAQEQSHLRAGLLSQPVRRALSGALAGGLAGMGEHKLRLTRGAMLREKIKLRRFYNELEPALNAPRLVTGEKHSSVVLPGPGPSIAQREGQVIKALENYWKRHKMSPVRKGALIGAAAGLTAHALQRSKTNINYLDKKVKTLEERHRLTPSYTTAKEFMKAKHRLAMAQIARKHPIGAALSSGIKGTLAGTGLGAMTEFQQMSQASNLLQGLAKRVQSEHVVQ